MTQLPISSILLGDRVRKDMGDLQSLADSIKAHGLLHPVVVKKDKTLVAGHRRVEAARLLGWKEIPVTVVDVADLLSAERDENTVRKDFTPTEAVAIGRLIEEQERPLALARMHAGRPPKSSVNFTEVNRGGKHPQVTDVVGPAVGMSGPTYARAKAVVVAAEQNPSKFGDLPAHMDETSVLRAHTEMQRRKTGNGRNPALRKMAYLKPNREVERAVLALDGICHVLKEIQLSELEKDKRAAWARSIKKSASDLNRFARRLNG